MKAWHYSELSKLAPIWEAQELLPSNTASLYAVPLLWFSKNQDWEPMAALFFGRKRESCLAMRFGLDITDSRLMDWHTTCTLARRSRQQRRHAEQLSWLPHETQWLATFGGTHY